MSMASDSTYLSPSPDANIMVSSHIPFIITTEMQTRQHSVFPRKCLREPAAEFFGVMIIVMFGLGVPARPDSPGTRTSRR